MGTTTGIEWTDSTWSPIRARVRADAAEVARALGYASLVPIAEKMAGRVGQHCEHVSPGCENCYAERMQHRCLPGNGTGLPYDRRSRDLVEAFVDEKALGQPLGWRTIHKVCVWCEDGGTRVAGKPDGCSCERRPRRIFVENQSDLFGEWVTDEMLDRIFAVMALSQQHIFQVLTKRPERMLAYFDPQDCGGRLATARVRVRRLAVKQQHLSKAAADPYEVWPPPNVWLGVSVENQEQADKRIPLLLQTPAAVRFLSAEPLLGPVELDRWLKVCKHWNSSDSLSKPPWNPPYPKYSYKPQALVGAGWKRPIDWVIAGGESGPGARPMHPDWARGLRDQCVATGVPFFFKQWGEWLPALCDGAPGDGQNLNCSDEPVRAGKKAAGSLLDGVAWKQFPEVRRGGGAG